MLQNTNLGHLQPRHHLVCAQARPVFWFPVHTLSCRVSLMEALSALLCQFTGSDPVLIFF